MKLIIRQNICNRTEKLNLSTCNVLSLMKFMQKYFLRFAIVFILLIFYFFPSFSYSSEMDNVINNDTINNILSNSWTAEMWEDDHKVNEIYTYLFKSHNDLIRADGDTMKGSWKIITPPGETKVIFKIKKVDMA